MNEGTKVERIKFGENALEWILINEPTKRSIDYLRRKYKFHKLDLEDCLSEIQRPKIDEYENYLFIVLHFPELAFKRIENSELDVFVGQNFVIIMNNGNSVIRNVFGKCKKNKKLREEYMGKGSGYLLYMIIDDLFESCFPISDNLTKELNDLEKEVFDQNYSRDRLKEILFLKKDIINFRRIIMPQRPIVALLEHKNKKFLPEKLDIYFDDIVDKIERMWNMLENLQELATSLHETNESIISHNTSNIIKILTLFSVVMLPLTFITGFYGMNVERLPLADSPLASEIIAGIIIGIAVSMFLYFRHKKWL